MYWKKLLAYISGSVDEDLLLRNEYLVTENRVLRAQIKGSLRLTDGERKTLAEIGKILGKKVLEEVASIVKPETILAWHRRLVAGVWAAWLREASWREQSVLRSGLTLRRTQCRAVPVRNAQGVSGGRGDPSYPTQQSS